MSSAVVEGYPGCPPLSWIIASRVTSTKEVADAFVTFTGRKGSGKSTSSISFCESVAEEIARARGRGEPATKFFNINHIRSITEAGAADLLTSGALQQENSVFLLDDSGTQWGSRNFQSPINKALNSILQIARVYRCVLVANFIMQGHVDVQARGMTDFRAEMAYKNLKTEQAFFKFFFIEQGDNGGEFRKYLRWKGKRVTMWAIGKPSPKLYADYQKMRLDNTTSYIDLAREKLLEKLNPSPKKDGRIKNILEDDDVRDILPQIKKMINEETGTAEMMRQTGMSRWRIDKVIGAIRRNNA